MESQRSDLSDARKKPIACETDGRGTLKMNELENEKVNVIYAET